MGHAESSRQPCSPLTIEIPVSKRSYQQSDVEVLFRRGNWQNWDDAIHWLEENGHADEELGPGEAQAMRQDLLNLRDRGFRFTHKPDEVYKMAHEHRHREQHPARS